MGPCPADRGFPSGQRPNPVQPVCTMDPLYEPGHPGHPGTIFHPHPGHTGVFHRFHAPEHTKTAGLRPCRRFHERKRDLLPPARSFLQRNRRTRYRKIFYRTDVVRKNNFFIALKRIIKLIFQEKDYYG